MTQKRYKYSYLKRNDRIELSKISMNISRERFIGYSSYRVFANVRFQSLNFYIIPILGETRVRRSTFHFLGRRNSCDNWTALSGSLVRAPSNRCEKFIGELSSLVWRLRQVAKAGIEQRGK